MACSNCNTSNCGCSGTYTVSQTCPPACSEVFNTACVVYTGVDITCPDNTTGMTSTVVSRNDYLDTALTRIINYFCGRFNSLVIPTTVVESNDPGIIVTEQILGSVTTYLLSLDPAELPSASQVTAGDNVVVTGDGSGGDPYVVNSHESIVDVTPGTALSVSTSSTGPYENTYTIDIDASLLPVTELNTSFAHISIVPTPNSPNAGDTTYTLEVDEVTITSVDAKIDVVNTAAGGIAPFERTFTVDVNETEMGNYIMDTASGILAQGGIIADPASAITVGYDALTHTITIGESIGVPFQWKTISDGASDIVAASPNDKLRIVSGTGASVALATGPGANEGTFTITNTDLGSAQSTYTDFVCTNTSGGGTPGTCAATSNGQVLNLVGGDGCDLSVDALSNTITIDNLVNKVYASVVGDDGPVLTADGIVDQLDVLGGDGINTVGTTGPGGNVLTIENEALVYSTITGDTGSSPASGLNDSLAIVSSGAGCSTTVTADTVTIENTGVITVSAGSNIIVDNADPQNPIVRTRANATVDDTTVTTQDIAATAGNPGSVVSLTHTIGVQYAQIRVIANTVLTGSFVANQDITSDFAIIMTGVDAYTLESTTYTGNVRVIVVGTV